MEEKRANLNIGSIMAMKGVGATAVSRESGVAYNTALSYQRDASEMVSKGALAKIAESLDVEPWELWVPDREREMILEIAGRAGVEVGEGDSLDDILTKILEAS